MRTIYHWPAKDFERGTPPILCTNCGDELMAVGSVEIHGLSVGYAWTHLDGQELCRVRSPKARPYDDYDAERSLKATRDRLMITRKDN